MEAALKTSAEKYCPECKKTRTFYFGTDYMLVNYFLPRVGWCCTTCTHAWTTEELDEAFLRANGGSPETSTEGRIRRLKKTKVTDAIDLSNMSPKSDWKLQAPPLTAACVQDTSGGLKFDTDKPRMELLDPEFLEEVAKVMTFGAKKYAAHNWRKGLEISRLLGACLRHVTAVVKGEDKDLESGCSHLAHATCCLMFAWWMLKYRTDLDDRYKQ